MRRVVVAAIAFAVATTSDAHAYEFWLRAQSIGQAYQLRQYRLVGPDLFLGRRRYSQTLALRITDVGNLSATRRQKRLPDRGLRISWQSYLRIDHDFGTFITRRIKLTPSVQRDSIDVIPELAESVAALDVLYAHMTLEGLADDRVTLQLGRVLADDGWGSAGLDGGTLRYELPMPLAITAAAGLRVRAASPLALSAFELDGTSGAGCQEYVEGPTPGAGTWKLIDRNRTITGSKLASDYELCPQRQVRQPTVGFTVATSRTRRIGAEIGYRRTWSETVGVFDEVDRLPYPDLGLYPDDAGQAPATGVNEERIHARVHGELRAGSFAISPYANARLSLLHAAIDRADAGIRVRRGDHIVEPTVEYFLPTFDGDSIFNAFSIEPTTDLRLGYQFAGALRIRANGWLRRYANAEDGAFAGGVDAGVEHPLARGVRGRIDGLWDDGYGGRRIGGTGELAWQARPSLWLRGRVIVLGVRREDRSDFVTSSAVLSSSLRIADSVGLHVVAEADHDQIHQFQTRVFAILDLAFAPEP
ncbi:MAG: hypothetical protein JWP01_51 [Myxococcales bacterium]|nr:hypothetical protein [Myxococcales bacterium]